PLSRPIRLLWPPQSTTPVKSFMSLSALLFINMLHRVPRHRLTIAIVPPFLRPIPIILALPDRRLMLDAVNNMPVGRISLTAVGRSRDDHHRRFPNLHAADPMLSDRYAKP